MVNVEADVLAGAHLAQQAETAGVVYSMPYGDQPALTCELVDWAHSSGFEVVAAGKGTNICHPIMFLYLIPFGSTIDCQNSRPAQLA